MEAVILHLSSQRKDKKESVKSSWMYIDWLNEKRFSNSRAFFCPSHIFISFYLEAASRVVSHCLFCVSFLWKQGFAWVNVKTNSSKFLLYFAVPQSITKLSYIITILTYFPSQTWYNTVFLPFYIWVIENHYGRFLFLVFIIEFVKLLAQHIFVTMIWVLCWDAFRLPFLF